MNLIKTFYMIFNYYIVIHNKLMIFIIIIFEFYIQDFFLRVSIFLITKK